MTSREDFQSFIPAERSISEFTLKAVLVGPLLSVILGSANAYFGLYAGMTDGGEQASEWELAIKQTKVKPKEHIIRTGLLFTAGLIAGEALTGVIVAFIIIAGLNIVVFDIPPVSPGLLLWLFIALLVFYIPLREIFNRDNE